MHAPTRNICSTIPARARLAPGGVAQELPAVAFDLALYPFLDSGQPLFSDFVSSGLNMKFCLEFQLTFLGRDLNSGRQREIVS